jgi:hypothetical protein
MEWSDRSTNHRFGPNHDHDSSIRTSSRRRAGAEVEKRFLFFQGAFFAPAFARACWMRERPINSSADS